MAGYTQDHNWETIGEPIVTSHARYAVSLHCPGLRFPHGQGYSLTFTVDHIEIVERLLHALRACREDQDAEQQAMQDALHGRTL